MRFQKDNCIFIETVLINFFMGKFVQSFIVSLIKVLNSLIKTQETAIIGLITTGVIIINH